MDDPPGVDELMTRPVLTLLVGLLAFDVTAPWGRAPVRRPHLHSTLHDVDRDTTASSTRMDRTPLVVTRSVAIAAGICVAVVSAVTVVAPVLGVVASAALMGVLAHSRRVHHRRSVEARDAALPELIDTLVALVRSGLTPRLAWCELPACTPLVLMPFVEDVITAMDSGATFADALSRSLDDLGAAGHGLFDALVTAERYGSPLVPALDRLAVDAAARRRRVAESRAKQLPVRMAVPLVVCTLPSFVLLGIVPVLVATLSTLTRP